MVEILKGRRLSISLHFGDSVLQFMRLHIEPAADLEERKSLMRHIKAIVVDASTGISLIMGDLNFTPAGEAKLQVDTGAAICNNDSEGQACTARMWTLPD